MLLPCCCSSSPTTGIAYGQDIDSPSIGVFGGGGAQAQGVAHGAIQTGASLEQMMPNGWGGYIFEGGYIGPVNNLHGGSALFSFNYAMDWRVSRKSRLFPFATAGYTQLFGTGHAANFGVGVDYRLSAKFGIRVEARDYYSFSLHEHNVAIRIGFRRYFWD